MRKLLLGAITILILACSENKENEGMQSASSAIKTRSGTWILEQVKDTYVFGEQLQLQCSGEGYSGKIPVIPGSVYFIYIIPGQSVLYSLLYFI